MDGFAGDASEWPTGPGGNALEYSIRRQLREVGMDLSAKLDRLLRENAAVREASEELVREAGRLKAEIEKERARERQKKPPRVARLST